MVSLGNLKEFFFRNKEKCHHLYPKKITIADAVDREGDLIRISFCTECKDYKWKDVSEEKWEGEFLSRLKKDKYYVYSTLEELAIYKKSFKGVFGKGK